MARRMVGRVSRMRVSSVTTPSLSGTLKSTRRKTRLPRRSRSLMASLVMSVVRVPCLVIRAEAGGTKPRPYKIMACTITLRSKLGSQEFDQVAAAAGVAPFVVVPGKDLDAAVAYDFGVFGVDDRRMRVALKVGGDEFFLGVAEDAFHGAFGCGFEGGVDGFPGGGLVDENGEIDDADIRSGDAHGVAVELAFKFGDDEMERLGGAGGAGNHVDGGGTGAAEIFVREIEEALIVGVGVNGGHGAAVDAESVMKDFGDRSEAIGGAGGVGNDVMLGGIVGFVVDAEDESGVGTVGWRRDDDFLYRTAEMLFGFGAFGEESGGFDDDIGADGRPIDFCRIFYLEHFNAFAFDGDGIFGVGDFVREIAEDGIVLEEVREGFSVGDVVDGDELNVLIVDGSAHNIAADAAEAVDAYLDGHAFLRRMCVRLRHWWSEKRARQNIRC